jgi:hypothetical protein
MRGTGVVGRKKAFVYSTEKCGSQLQIQHSVITTTRWLLMLKILRQRSLRNPIALVYVLRTVFETTTIDWFSYH